jgi:peptidyl-tRNA hydrolase, PTH1 family
MRRRAPVAARRGTPADLLVVGLGNPGRDYDRTKHNVGAEVIELLVTRHGGRLRSGKERAQTAELRFADRLVATAVPETWMNDSGEAVHLLVRRYGVAPDALVVVHDELDLPVGTVRVKDGGGLAGHNGLRSIADHLHTNAFVRVRIGIGKPSSKEQGADHVLSRFGKSDRELVDQAIARATDAVEAIATDGLDAAMRVHNTSDAPSGGAGERPTSAPDHPR